MDTAYSKRQSTKLRGNYSSIKVCLQCEATKYSISVYGDILGLTSYQLEAFILKDYYTQDILDLGFTVNVD